MAKVKDRSETEMLRGENKKLRSEIRQLRKILGRFQKQAHRVEELEDLFENIDLFEEQQVKEIKEIFTCPLCSKGNLIKTNLGNRKLITCDSCKFRRTEK